MDNSWHNGTFMDNTQEKISENSGYFGIRDCHLNDRKVVTYSEQR